MNNKNLEQLLDINKLLSTTPPPNIHSVRAYVLNINISDIFSITFDTPYETLPTLTKIDNTSEKILHLQYSHLTSAVIFSNGDCLLNSISLIFNANQTLALQFRLAMIVELIKFSDFYLSQKIFKEDYYFSDAALNSVKNSDMPITYNKEREYIGKIAYMSKPHRFCLIIGLYDLASDKKLRNHPKVGKIITRNEVQCKCKKIIKLHHAYNPKNLEKYNQTSNCLLTKGIRSLTSYFTNFTKSKQFSCIGLRDKEHLKYLQRIGGIIYYGGAPCIEVLAKELFPKKFDKDFNWKRLTNNEKNKLENELTARAKWRNDFNSNCI
ncbi:7087_t:CDS:2 [Funneliformis caledonium]|uniref:7087_t:CDS:1 n=1 Tax=Funneliformis caledonium TaxID=1117310 RepID=A0A9N9DXP1_9GLOM|nr:7087_t:CDS:2 [Funneliformis caledonium]